MMRHQITSSSASQALELCGGEFAGLSKAMKGEKLPGLEPGSDQEDDV